jgi:hypothetical protein
LVGVGDAVLVDVADGVGVDVFVAVSVGTGVSVGVGVLVEVDVGSAAQPGSAASIAPSPSLSRPSEQVAGSDVCSGVLPASRGLEPSDDSVASSWPSASASGHTSTTIAVERSNGSPLAAPAA